MQLLLNLGKHWVFSLTHTTSSQTLLMMGALAAVDALRRQLLVASYSRPAMENKEVKKGSTN